MGYAHIPRFVDVRKICTPECIKNNKEAIDKLDYLIDVEYKEEIKKRIPTIPHYLDMDEREQKLCAL